VITILTLCALTISLFGGYLDEPNAERLVSITKAIWKAGRNKSSRLNKLL
jgi:hypothetical protein